MSVVGFLLFYVVALFICECTLSSIYLQRLTSLPPSLQSGCLSLNPVLSSPLSFSLFLSSSPYQFFGHEPPFCVRFMVSIYNRSFNKISQYIPYWPTQYMVFGLHAWFIACLPTQNAKHVCRSWHVIRTTKSPSKTLFNKPSCPEAKVLQPLRLSFSCSWSRKSFVPSSIDIWKLT